MVQSATIGDAASVLPDISEHISTIGVKRPSYGEHGRRLDVWTNHFEVKIPEANIYHYDGARTPIGLGYSPSNHCANLMI